MAGWEGRSALPASGVRSHLLPSIGGGSDGYVRAFHRRQLRPGGERTDLRDFRPGNWRGHRQRGASGTADVEKAIVAARHAFDRGEWSRLAPDARARRCYEFADRIAADSIRLAATESMDSGQVIGLSKYWACSRRRLCATWAITRPRIPVAGRHSLLRQRLRSRPRVRPQGAGRRLRGHHPLEFPDQHGDLEDRPCHRHGQLDRAEASLGYSADRADHRRSRPGRGHPAGRDQRPAGSGRRAGERTVHSPGRRQDRLHRQHRGRRRHHADGIRHSKEGHAQLGGKSANIILDDADLELAVEGAVFGTFFHQGQVCESGTRVLVSGAIYDEFVERMRKRTEELRVGYQLLPTSHLGPLVNATQLATVEEYVRLGIEEGAELVSSGSRCGHRDTRMAYITRRPSSPKFATTCASPRKRSSGPWSASIGSTRTRRLSPSRTTRRMDWQAGSSPTTTSRAERIAREVRTGTMWINNFHIFGDYAPFGGYKQSGVGQGVRPDRSRRIHGGEADPHQLVRVTPVQPDHEDHL